jgi:type IV fimbrial biogenesis protein FimT
MQHNTHQTGFTLIEALVAIAIAAIILGIAVPNFQDFIRNTRLTTQANEFVLLLAYAKSEAVKRNRNVEVCSSDDGIDCDATNDWSAALIVLDATSDEVLQVSSALPAACTTPTADGCTSITFANTGFRREGVSKFTLCTSGTTSGREITLSPQGRAQTTTIDTCTP